MQERNESFFSEMVRFALLTLAIVLPIRFFIAEPFIVSGSSMEPTFENAQYLIVDQLTYHVRAPERGEVIIFHYPLDPSKYFIKRIVGLPGDTVVLSGNDITIKNTEHPEGFKLDESYIARPAPANGTYTVGADQYFVMGDNRGASSDSRIWGNLPKNLIVGRAFVRLFPPSTVTILPGDHPSE